MRDTKRQKKQISIEVAQKGGKAEYRRRRQEDGGGTEKKTTTWRESFPGEKGFRLMESIHLKSTED